MSNLKQGLAGITLFALLLLAYAIYIPGLSGGFSFDDYPTLHVIQDVGGIHNTDSFLRFVLTGETGPMGRPLSLLTFLLDTLDWPADPGPFIYTNIMLHLLNATLICWFALQLGRILNLAPNALLITTLGTTAIWLLHPINVPAVLFIVQRMTELMATFTLAGLIAYTHGRQLLGKNPMRGYAWMSAGIVIGGVLSTLSKENGILLPLYALTLERFLFRAIDKERPRHWKPWSSVFLYAPLFMLAGYFVLHWHGHLVTYSQRDFNLVERLMSECRALSDYLRLIVLPRMSGISVFNDDYLVSRSLFNPPTTLPGILFICTLLLLSLAATQRYRVIGFAIAWFFAGHILESTIVPLEIYFQHRNYLPMFGIVFALAYLLATTPQLNASASTALLSLFVGLEAFLTFQTAKLWGEQRDQAEIWANEHPASIRAQQLAARYWTATGDLMLARQHLRQAVRYHPRDAGVALQVIQNECLARDYKSADLGQITARLAHAPLDNITIDAIDQLTDLLESKDCPGLKVADIKSIITPLMQNPYYQNQKGFAHLYYTLARLSYIDHDLNGAIVNLDRSFSYKQNVDIALNAAYWLATAGLYQQALEKIALARQADQNLGPLLRNTRRQDIDYWEKYIHNLEHHAGKQQHPH